MSSQEIGARFKSPNGLTAATIEKKRTDFVQKRLPQRLPMGKTDLLVSRNSEFVVQFAKGKRLLEAKQHPSITIHGLGAAINRAINLTILTCVPTLPLFYWMTPPSIQALQLQSKVNIPIQIKSTTSTVSLVDDLLPAELDERPASSTPHTQVRNNSAVHITLTKAATPL
eukprot:gene6004-30741_t